MATVLVLGHGRAYKRMEHCPVSPKTYIRLTTGQNVVLVDNDPAMDPDLVFDVTEKWPIESASVQIIIDTAGIYSSHFFKFDAFIDEVKRTLVDGGEYFGSVAPDRINILPGLERMFTKVEVNPQPTLTELQFHFVK